MANIKSAKKRIRVIDKKTARNKRIKNHAKEAIKDFELALEANDMKAAEEKLLIASRKLQMATSKGTFHKNTTSRKISRLTQKFNKAKA